VAAVEVLARFLRFTRLGSKLALEHVDHLTQTAGVDALLASLKLAHRGLQFGERIELVQHAKSISNRCLGLKR
jgi:hypothetical protein